MLTRLSGLSNITTVGEDLVIVDNNALPDLNVLSSVAGRIDGDLIVWGNDALINIDGLRGVTSVGGSLGIGCYWSASFRIRECPGNASLTNLDGLANVASVGGEVAIAGNRALPTCAAEAFVALLRARGWAGVAYIADNDDTGTCE